MAPYVEILTERAWCVWKAPPPYATYDLRQQAPVRRPLGEREAVSAFGLMLPDESMSGLLVFTIEAGLADTASPDLVARAAR